MDTGILLESGTNELEILEFIVGNNHYGINVAKISEILTYQEPTSVPNSHESVEGIFMPRDEIVSVIDLGVTLKAKGGNKATDKYIVTKFNHVTVAFHVHGVVGIHRVSWQDLSKPDGTLSAPEKSIATGIVRINDKLVVILDFEKIVSDINPETGLKLSDIRNYSDRDPSDLPIITADDSNLLSKLICGALQESGYTNIDVNGDGQEVWDKLQKYKKEGTIDKHCVCVITDIEMPRMDGHRLLKLIKSDPELSHIPVIIFSSLINDEMRVKGDRLGVDAQLTKPEIGELVGVLDRLLNR